MARCAQSANIKTNLKDKPKELSQMAGKIPDARLTTEFIQKYFLIASFYTFSTAKLFLVL
jgi:hypothetical protein